jgi:phosphatidylserine/phosphatidylglycerophosphate/cardiolipin synthase-like enzyme
MINPEIIQKIETFVQDKPRTIQEISELLNKNWRTADRYVEKIVSDYGTIAVRTFRGGTKGALKIVYFAGIESKTANIFQKELEMEISSGKNKQDFRAFDIYQYADNSKKEVDLSTDKKSMVEIKKKMVEEINSAKKQIISFSGDLSFTKSPKKEPDIFKALERAIKRGIQIKIVCRVDFVGKKNIENLLSLNRKYGKELVSIKHKWQPLRGMIIDNKLLRIKEIRLASEEDELDKNLYLYYKISDPEWVDWIIKVFWKMFQSSISAQIRLEQLEDVLRSKKT